MCSSNKKNSYVNNLERENITATPAKKQCLEGNASKIAESTTCWRKWKKTAVEFDPKNRNSELSRQIAKDRKKDRAYIPPLHFFKDNSLEDEEVDLDGLDYDELHLAFEREKSPNGQQLECSFCEDWEKFNGVAANENDANRPAIMILQLAKVIYQDNDRYDEKNHAISLYSPVKKEVTIEKFFDGGIKKLVGSIRESGYDDDDVLETPPPTIGKGISIESNGIAGSEDEHVDTNTGGSGGSDKGKRTVIDLDEYDKEAALAKRSKKPMMAVKIEKP
uniref:Replication protein A 70 kDa DNA-binding subunit B n=1 Tax=Tanacetum cinerariifolium TaxID=118510 RepID=A0A6L2NQS6_TANCI|nr:replication protein A 70 kDa DNA-binding subunit B [Tanacetum cinerariifolium]